MHQNALACAQVLKLLGQLLARMCQAVHGTLHRQSLRAAGRAPALSELEEAADREGEPLSRHPAVCERWWGQSRGGSFHPDPKQVPAC